MNNLSASIVIYKNQADILAKTIFSFLNAAPQSTLHLIDNSPTDQLKYLAYDKRITYTFNRKNIGFGAAHNISLRRIIDKSKYHLVLNPDVFFEAHVLEEIHSYMEQHPSIGQLMPRVLYPDGRLQHLCKLLPTPKTLVLRRFFNFLNNIVARENYHYELQFSGYDKIMDVPFLSGCFMFLRTEALKKSGLFDERFFLYTEDTDLTRRIHRHYRTIYFPEVSIYHYHTRGSYKDPWLMMCNIKSAFQYFNKWGWLRDEEREIFNRRAVEQFSGILQPVFS